MGSIKERVSIEVSLIIAVVDDFSGQPVSRSQLRVWIDGERPPAAKEGGYFLFTNMRTDRPVIHLEGPVFYSQEIILDEKEWQHYQGKVLKVRMIPNRSYPVPRNTTCVQGHAVPGSTILAYHKTLKEPFKLLYPYKAGQEEISIFHPDDMDLEGKRFCIQNKEQTEQEIFRIAGRTDANEEEKKTYQLYTPLAHSYKKIGTAVYPVYVSEADKSGEFYLPATGIHSERAVFVFWIEGNEEGQKEMELQNGKVNLLSETLS